MKSGMGANRSFALDKTSTAYRFHCTGKQCFVVLFLQYYLFAQCKPLTLLLEAAGYFSPDDCGRHEYAGQRRKCPKHRKQIVAVLLCVPERRRKV